MNESTPLRRPAPHTYTLRDGGGASSNNGTDLQQMRHHMKGVRRRIRVLASLLLAVTIVLYFSIVTPMLPANQPRETANATITTVGPGRADSSSSIGAKASPTTAPTLADSMPVASASAALPSASTSTSKAPTKIDGVGTGAEEGGESIKSTNLLLRPQANAANRGNYAKEDQVTFVPGFGAPLEKQYAGLIKVNEQAVGKLFYWFFEARDQTIVSAETPLLIWLNGGPGASSMTGLFTEMGPYRIMPDGKLIPHPQSWTNLGHMLFFDQPVGTGYSSVRDDNGYVDTQDQMAEQLYRGLQGFYRHHPEYVANPVYICGESYAGKYVPHIAHYIHTKNASPQPANSEDVAINLTGLTIGNGKMWPVLQTRSVPDFAIALGLIDSQQYEQANADISVCEEFHRQGRHVDAFQVCQSVTDSIYKNAGNPFIYDIRKTGNAFDELTAVLNSYFNNDQVRRALNVPMGTPWNSYDGSSYGISVDAPPLARHLLADEMLDVSIDIFRDLLDNYKFLFYAGNMDGSSCNNLGVSRMIDRLAWTGTSDYRVAQRQPWVIDGQVAGLAKTSGNMSYVVVLNSGHLVPTDQPVAALDMMRRFLNDEQFTAL
uniref:Carboxypeptidase n=1 Tax=Globisporangium ultimum (strain ATCC 200006 / CBS 805.95 / DAOM BR144) TaxID=431595 RepID=K3X2K8_GLOUD